MSVASALDLAFGLEEVQEDFSQQRPTLQIPSQVDLLKPFYSNLDAYEGHEFLTDLEWLTSTVYKKKKKKWNQQVNPAHEIEKN